MGIGYHKWVQPSSSQEIPVLIYGVTPLFCTGLTVVQYPSQKLPVREVCLGQAWLRTTTLVTQLWSTCARLSPTDASAALQAAHTRVPKCLLSAAIEELLPCRASYCRLSLELKTSRALQIIELVVLETQVLHTPQTESGTDLLVPPNPST